MLNSMTPEQLREWSFYYALEPWGMEADDFRMAMMASVTAAAAGTKDFDPWPLTVRHAMLNVAQVADEDTDNVEAFLDAKFGLVN